MLAQDPYTTPAPEYFRQGYQDNQQQQSTDQAGPAAAAAADAADAGAAEQPADVVVAVNADGDEVGVAEVWSPSTREFRLKVFAVVMLHLLVMTGFMCWFHLYPGTKGSISSHPHTDVFQWIAFFLIWKFVLAKIKLGDTERPGPAGLVVLALWVPFITVIISMATIFARSEAVKLAAVLTPGLALPLMLLAHNMKHDLTTFGFNFLDGRMPSHDSEDHVTVPWILTAVVGFVGFMMFVCGPGSVRIVGKWLIAVVWCLICFCHVMWDYQLVIGGRHKRAMSYNNEAYVPGGIVLYVIIAGLFLSVVFISIVALSSITG